MEKEKVDLLVKVLSEVITHRFEPISPKQMKSYCDIENSSLTSTEYDRLKTNLQNILDFYNESKIITIVTDTVENEIKKLKKRKDMEKLKPYVELLRQKSVESLNQRNKEIKSVKNDNIKVSQLELKNMCDKYSKVEKVKSKELVYVNDKDKKINESFLPNDYDDLITDDKGYRIVYIDGQYVKVKSKYIESTSYELVGEKFEYIDVNFNNETVEYKTKHFTNESTKTIKKTICLEDEVDLEDKEISPYDIGYRLFLECDFKDERGNLDSPIEFQIPQNNIDLFVENFVSMVGTFGYNIKSEKLVRISKSNLYRKIDNSDNVIPMGFLTNTITQTILKVTESNPKYEKYPINMLIDLAQLKSKVNIVVDNNKGGFIKELYVSIKKIVVYTNNLTLQLDNGRDIDISNVNQIEMIYCLENNDLLDNISRLKVLTDSFRGDDKSLLIEIIEELEKITNFISKN